MQNNSLESNAIAPVESSFPIVSQPLKPDYNEGLRFLKILGKTEQTSRLRAIFPTRKGGGKCLPCSEENFLQYNNGGWNIYAVINPGGDKDDEITECIAIFMEHDDLDKDIQLDLHRALGLPEPTIQVDTSRNSIHSFWVFETPISVTDWRKIQSDLIVFSSADKSIKNPSRVMRYPGSLYYDKVSGEATGMAKIVTASEKKYSFEELRAAIPEAPAKGKQSKVKVKPIKPIPPVVMETSQSGVISYDDAIARIEELSGDPSQYNRYHHDFTQDSTDLSKWRGDCPWHDSKSKTPFYLNQSPDGKFRWHCPECQVGGTLIEYHAKMDGLPSVPTGRAFLDFVEAKFDGIKIDRSSVRSQSTQSKSPATSGGIQSNVVAFPGKSPGDGDIQQLKAELDELLAKSTKKSEISRFKATRSLSPSLQKLVDDWVEEYRQSSINDDEKKNLLKVIGSNSSLRLTDYLPEVLALSMSEWSADVQIPQACVLTAFLPLVAHMIGQSDIRLSATWVEPSILFSCIAGKSGSGKSPLFRAIVQSPLMQFQQEHDREYLQKKEEYDSWRRLPRDQKEDTPEPPEPIRRLSYLSNFTAEALHALADQFPEQGAMIVSDELSEIFNNQGKYSGGRGSEKEEILKSYDGILGNIGRKSGNSGGKKFYLNISGATQIETLQDLIRRRNVNSGEWSRFLICELPYVKIKHSLIDSKPIDLSPIIVCCCKQLQEYERQEYRLSPSAFVDHKVFCNELEDMAYEELNEGFRLAIKKAKGQVGRLALALHCLDASCDAVSLSPASQVSDRTMAKAIALTRFYLAQADKLYRLQDENSLTPDLEAILDLARRKGSITPGDVARSFSGKRRKSGEQARALMVQLADMGIGQVKPSGKSIVYMPPVEEAGKVDNVDRKLIKVDKFINDENTLTASITDSEESKVDKVDKISNFPTNIEIPPDISTLSSGGTGHQTDGCLLISENISSRNLSTLSTLEISDAENLARSDVDNVDKVINFVSTKPSTLSTLEKKDSNRDDSQEDKDPNRELTLEDIDLGGAYRLDGKRCVVVSFDWGSNPPVIDVRFDDSTKKTILNPKRLRFV